VIGSSIWLFSVATSPKEPTVVDNQAANTPPPMVKATSNFKSGPGPTIREIKTNETAYARGQIPRYEKLEITFQVDTKARNLQWPFDAAPPSGIEPGSGVSVEALFSPDDWQTVYFQPAFYYQDFQAETKNDQSWLYPTHNFSWKVRFTPNREGNWQYKLTAQDASGTFETQAASFMVTPSANKGFIRVSQTDPRYFEFEDGTYFPGLGYNLDIPIAQADLSLMSENGIQLIRTWLPSQLSIFGSAWSPWQPFGAAPWASVPNARLRYDAAWPFNRQPGVDPPLARPESELFLWLSHNETVYSDGNPWDFLPCIVTSGWNSRPLPVKRNTDYRIRVRYKEYDLAGPKVSGQSYGFAVKTGGWLWDEQDEHLRCYYPGTGTLLAANHKTASSWSNYPDPENEGWQILEGNFKSGDADFLDMLYLTIENATSGSVLVDYVWLEENLGSGQYSPNIISKPWMAFHHYFDQQGSYAFDQTLELAKQYGIYFKLVILEKNDFALNIFEPDGQLATQPPGQNPRVLFLGNGRETSGKTKIRWLEEAWWRYLQARWGYSPNIHSWELLNEGDPNNDLFYILTDEFGKYFQQTFTPPGQAAKHPNLHLVTTSFWYSFPNQFWRSSDYPYVDYADVHQYAQESNMQPLDYVYELSDFNDSALFSQKLSLYHGAKQPDGPGKPVIRGETGWFFDGEDLFAQNVTAGLWLHNFIWAGINSGGLMELLWTGGSSAGQLYQAESHDHRPMYRSFYNFIKDIPLNNGHFQEAEAISSHPDLRVWGQKDLVHSQAHLWIQNRQHTWRNVADGVSIPAISGTVTISDFEPGRRYTAQWWDTFQTDPTRQILRTETLVAQRDGSLIIAVANLDKDIAVKLFSR
jgi:hypothetical protein